MGQNAGQNVGQNAGQNAGQNMGKIMEKLWENFGKILGKFWENLKKKLWENLGLFGKFNYIYIILFIYLFNLLIKILFYFIRGMRFAGTLVGKAVCGVRLMGLNPWF